MQQWLKGAETDPIEMFWPNGQRVDENTARNRIVERLQGRLKALDSSLVIEHHMAEAYRCDFTASKSIAGAGGFWFAKSKGNGMLSYSLPQPAS